MNIEILTAIVARAEARFEGRAWLEIRSDESWILRNTRDYIDPELLISRSETNEIASGDTFGDLPALLSLLKNHQESLPNQG